MGIIAALKSWGSGTGPTFVASAQEAFVGPTGLQAYPVPQGPVIKAVGPKALTSGSQLNRAAVGGVILEPQSHILSSGSQLSRAQAGAPWPPLPADYTSKRFTGFVRSALHDWFPVKIGANYGENASVSKFGFTDPLFEPFDKVLYAKKPPVDPGPVVGLYPGPVPSPYRPMYNLLPAIVWQLQVVDPNAQAQPGELSSPPVVSQASMEFTPAGTASLQYGQEETLV
jgi:hypothetical protein